jgi:ureidoacrylate peracid hydrolase
MEHPSSIDPAVVDKVVRRRGRLHAYETLDPAATALVVIDLNTGTVEDDLDALIPVVTNVNRVAERLREAGGVIAWVTPYVDEASQARLAVRTGVARAAMFAEQSRPGSRGAALWHQLRPADDDLHVTKPGASAFFPGTCDLDDRLRERGVTGVLIAGTVTNVCCESSARDATELGYQVTMISDACAGHSYGLHEASLTTFYRIFGDVRPTNDVLDLLNATVEM